MLRRSIQKWHGLKKIAREDFLAAVKDLMAHAHERAPAETLSLRIIASRAMMINGYHTGDESLYSKPLNRAIAERESDPDIILRTYNTQALTQEFWDSAQHVRAIVTHGKAYAFLEFRKREPREISVMATERNGMARAVELVRV